jgi:hypothetical protein
MLRGAVAPGCHVDLARIGLGVGNELRDRRCGNRRIDLQHQRSTNDAGDRRYVADEIETEIFIKRHVDGVRKRGQQQRVAVRRRLSDKFGGDVAARAGPVLDDELLAEPLRQPLRNEARRNIWCNTRRKTDQDADRPRRIGIRPSSRPGDR